MYMRMSAVPVNLHVFSVLRALKYALFYRMNRIDMIIFRHNPVHPVNPVEKNLISFVYAND